MQKAIYMITNNINHKSYIGQSNNPTRRFREHCESLENYKSMISDAIHKYGRENFTFQILGWYEDYNEKERYFIQYYRTLAPYGYNIARGGEEPPHESGEKNSFAKISQQVADNIKKDLLNWDITRKQIIKKYHVTTDIVRHINDGTSWHDDQLSYPLRPSEPEILKVKVDKVIDLLQNTGLSQKEIGRLVGWNRSAITMINIGQNHHRDNLNYPIRTNRHYKTCND